MILNPIILNFFPKGSDQEISFNREDFLNIAKTARETKVEIQDAQSKVVEAVEELRKQWQTPTGRKFFENLDANWAADISKFTRTMDAFIDVMEEVEEQFRDIENEVWCLQNIDRML